MFSLCKKCKVTFQCSMLILILSSLLEYRRSFAPPLAICYTQSGLADIVLAELISPTHMVELYPGMQRLNKWKIPGSFTSQSETGNLNLFGKEGPHISCKKKRKKRKSERFCPELIIPACLTCKRTVCLHQLGKSAPIISAGTPVPWRQEVFRPRAQHKKESAEVPC